MRQQTTSEASVNPRLFIPLLAAVLPVPVRPVRPQRVTAHAVVAASRARFRGGRARPRPDQRDDAPGSVLDQRNESSTDVVPWNSGAAQLNWLTVGKVRDGLGAKKSQRSMTQWECPVTCRPARSHGLDVLLTVASNPRRVRVARRDRGDLGGQWRRLSQLRVMFSEPAALAGLRGGRQPPRCAGPDFGQGTTRMGPRATCGTSCGVARLRRFGCSRPVAYDRKLGFALPLPLPLPLPLVATAWRLANVDGSDSQ